MRSAATSGAGYLGVEPVKSSRNRWFADSAAEGSGFELSVPLRRATTSELSVPPAVNAVGARLPRKRQVYPLSGWRRVLRSCCPHLAPCAAWSRSAPAIEFKGAPALHNNAQTDEVSVAQLY